MLKNFQRLLDSRLTRRQTREDEEDCQVVSNFNKDQGKKKKSTKFHPFFIHLIKDPETSRLIIYPFLGNLPNPGIQLGTPALQMDSETTSEALYVEKGNPNATYILN